MTTGTQTHQVGLIMRTTITKRQDMMNFLCRFHTPFLLALFTQRVLMNVMVTDPFPGPAIAFSGCWVTIVPLITSGFLFDMFFTEPTRCQLGTARVRAGSLWFGWHQITVRFLFVSTKQWID
jgi:hypothetical protein